MKKTKILVPICFLLALVACGNTDKDKPIITPIHEHTYSNVYNYDSEYHWFPSTCGHLEAKKQKEKHNFADFVIEKEPTISEKGVRSRTCQNCGYKESYNIEKKSNLGLVFTNPYKVQDAISVFSTSLNDFTVTEEQYYVKGKVSSASKSSNGYTLYFEGEETGTNASFVFIDGVIDSERVSQQYEAIRLEGATVEVYGYIRKRIASDGVSPLLEMKYLNYNESPTGGSISPKIVGVTNPKPVQQHTHTYSSAWSYNDSEHWHAATCEHTDEKSNLENHNFNAWTVDVEPTTTQAGHKYRICEGCKYKQEEVVPVHTHTFDTSIWSKDEFTHWHPATCGHNVKGNEAAHTFDGWNTVTPATTTSEGLEARICSVCSYKEERKIDKINNYPSGTFTLYTFNDFHGAVNEYQYDAHVGLEKFGTFLKNASKQDNVLIVDSGDTFQGSIESNWNSGEMITDVFNYAHVDVHTLGNHDFDWGEQKIEDNKDRKADDGWSMTNLGANIYDYYFDYFNEGETQQTRLGDKYYIKTMKNGLNVGVVGVIGKDQITSICTPLVQDICFKEHNQILKDLSDELRTEKGCDVVIASMHNGAEDSINNGLADVSPVSNKKYFDYVACGHSHRNEYFTENGVPFTQAEAYGQCIYKAEITVTNGNVTNYDVTSMDYDHIVAEVSSVDPNIKSIIAKYSPAYKDVGNEVIAPSVNGSFGAKQELPNLLCKAMFTVARNQYYNVDFAFCNEARYNISKNYWTYSTIYESFPFDNVIYIVRIRGDRNVKEICNYNWRYHESSLTSVDYTTWYTVAVIDYLLFHTNASRSYNYFSHGSSWLEILGTLKKDGKDYLYRDVLADYLRGYSGTLNSSDYQSSSSEFKKPTLPNY
ncbi:MAG: bifunctional metallophosphatase/5'-nucleotidase [Bacilli bacterium]|nr:bifunctional metallophosphatase/5'-nucleotidase [Bacilli bacterium]